MLVLTMGSKFFNFHTTKARIAGTVQCTFSSTMKKTVPKNLLEILDSDPEFLERHIPPRKVLVKDLESQGSRFPFGIEVSAVLKCLGLTFPFSTEGDLSEMIDSAVGDGQYVSSIFHTDFIEVNEEGPEAAAASGAVIRLRSLQIEPIDFVADHPFLFLIREDVTGVVMFFGHVLDPSLTT